MRQLPADEPGSDPWRTVTIANAVVVDVMTDEFEQFSNLLDCELVERGRRIAKVGPRLGKHECNAQKIPFLRAGPAHRPIQVPPSCSARDGMCPAREAHRDREDRALPRSVLECIDGGPLDLCGSGFHRREEQLMSVESFGGPLRVRASVRIKLIVVEEFETMDGRSRVVDAADGAGTVLVLLGHRARARLTTHRMSPWSHFIEEYRNAPRRSLKGLPARRARATATSSPRSRR